MSAYETSVLVQGFAGLDQTGDGYNKNLRFAVEMENVDTTNGQFKPYRVGVQVGPEMVGKTIGTLACLSRRYYVPTEQKDLLVAFAGGRMYTRVLGSDDPWEVRHLYRELGDGQVEDTGELELGTDYQSCVTYEINMINGVAMSEGPVDVLLFTSEEDGMFCLYGHDLKVVQVDTPHAFSVISRYNERVWGTGVEDMQDWLFYSTAFDPFNWLANEEIPEDGAGSFASPSWDGDRFLALYPYGSALLAFKKNTIWKIIGTDPGEFIVRAQFGPGTVVPNTIAVSGAYAFMLGYNGIVRYDGAQSVTYMQDNVQKLFNRVNFDAISGACAVMQDRTYLLALPIDGSTVNNAVLAYNSREGTFTLRTGIYVRSFLQIEDRVLYTSSVAPGRIMELCEEGHALPVLWKSGMQDLGLKSSVKSSFKVYYKAEAEAPFELVIGIQTDKKLKEKLIQVKPGKAARTAINVQGRYFQLIIRTRTIVPFSIVGGLKVDMELDPD